LRAPGQPLDRETRAFMEPRFGHDFSRVRVHTDARASESARAVNAFAYTVGRNVVFDAGQYAPHSRDGQQLLAHELTHVVQQQTLTHSPLLQRKAKATRFQDEPTLEDISDGKKILKEGDKGEAVIRVTTALSELGFYKIVVIDESFDPVLTTAVSSYQDSKGLKGKVPDGTVEKQTFGKLDDDFSAAASFNVERDVLSKQKAADIIAQTQTLDAAERAASKKAISTEPPVNPATGLPPVFHEDIPGKGKYGDRLRDAVDMEILDEWNAMGKGSTAKHADPSKLYDAPAVDAIAVESQKAVDAVFGEYTKGVAHPPLKLGVSVSDAFKKKEDALAAGGKAAQDAAVDWRVRKILNGAPAVKAIDREHGAIQTRLAEKAIVAPIKTALIAKHRDKLLETHKAWPGFESGGVVFVQLFKGATPDEQKRERWDFFQTFIHEYIHSLEHKDHVKYRESLDEQKGGFTLREGTTDYFTKIVWSSITIDEPLRNKIEGPVHDPAKPFAIQDLNVYPESENAERLAGVVGIRNEAAAFFLGKIELIGKTP
jgi:peptidoglycan hydrolase-like protein with peptidoglycan-binding domain